jgi:hypothetical protein
LRLKYLFIAALSLVASGTLAGPINPVETYEQRFLRLTGTNKTAFRFASDGIITSYNASGVETGSWNSDDGTFRGSLNAADILAGALDDARLSAAARDAITKRHTQNTDTGTNAATFSVNTAASGSFNAPHLVMKGTDDAGDPQDWSIDPEADGGQVNINFNGSPAVVHADTFNATHLVGEASGVTAVPAASLTGTISDARLSANVSLLGSSISSSEITDGTIVNADISSSAAVDPAKFGAGTWDVGAGNFVRINGRFRVQSSASYPSSDIGIKNTDAPSPRFPVLITDARASLGAGYYGGRMLLEDDSINQNDISASQIIMTGTGSQVANIMLSSASWSTLVPGTLPGVLYANYVATDKDVHSYRDGYFQGGLSVGQAAQDHTHDGSFWLGSVGSGGVNSTPTFGCQETRFYTDTLGLHAQNNHAAAQWGSVSHAFWFDDAGLFKGSLMTSGSVTATSYVGSGSALTGVVHSEADTLNSIAARGASTDYQVSLYHALELRMDTVSDIAGLDVHETETDGHYVFQYNGDTVGGWYTPQSLKADGGITGASLTASSGGVSAQGDISTPGNIIITAPGGGYFSCTDAIGAGWNGITEDVNPAEVSSFKIVGGIIVSYVGI